MFTPCNTCFLGPIRVHNPTCISISSAIFAQLTAECHWRYQGMPFCSKLSLPICGLEPPSNTWFLGSTWLSIKIVSRSGQPFIPSLQQTVSIYSQLMADSPNTLQWVPFPPKLPLSTGYLDSHLIQVSLGQPESSTQMVSRSVQPFLQGSLLWQTDSPCYSVCNSRLHLHT